MRGVGGGEYGNSSSSSIATSGQNLAIVLDVRDKPEDEHADHVVRVWNSTYERLISINARLMLQGKKKHDLTQIMDAVVGYVYEYDKITKLPDEGQDDYYDD